jgi:RimJ/RimL family protein N-acetyltransferase
MFIRPATYADVTEADKIYKSAKEYMKKSGNAEQWPGDYPSGTDVELGIKDGVSYVLEDDGEILATFLFKPYADDPTYRKIYSGEWLNDGPYSVIHRIAVKYHGKSLADFVFNECFKILPNIKIDTHKDNIPMQRCLRKNGFIYCGIIYLENGEERMAFEKI